MLSKQKGFAFLPFLAGVSPMTWVYIAVAVAFIGLSAAVKIQTSRLASTKAEYSQYRGGVEALGRAAEIAAAKQKLADIKAKERADEEVKSGRTRNSAVAERVRNDIAGRGVLPPSATAPGGAPGASVDWALVERALRDFADEAARGAAEGADAVTVLDALKRKAQSGP